jgi:hypothetical protein
MPCFSIKKRVKAWSVIRARYRLPAVSITDRQVANDASLPIGSTIKTGTGPAALNCSIFQSLCRHSEEAIHPPERARWQAAASCDNVKDLRNPSPLTRHLRER